MNLCKRERQAKKSPRCAGKILVTFRLTAPLGWGSEESVKGSRVRSLVAKRKESEKLRTYLNLPGFSFLISHIVYS